MKSRGFTIVEFLVASSVFALLLTIALAGFSGVGNLFYKGVSVTQTQSTTANIIRDVSSNIQTASTITGPSTAPNGYTYYCIGGIRYTYNLQKELDTTIDENLSLGTAVNFALVRDSLPGTTGCAPPCTSGCSAPFAATRQEMLGNRMRLMRFDITPSSSGSKFYNVYATVAYGDDEDFDNVGNPATIECKAGLQAQKFCAVNTLIGSAYQGLR